MLSSAQWRVGKEQCCLLGLQLTLLIHPQHEHTPKQRAPADRYRNMAGVCLEVLTAVMYSFRRAVRQHIHSFTSEQMPELLTKWMRKITDQVFLQPMISKCLAAQSLGSMRRRHSQCHCTQGPLCFLLWWVWSFSSVAAVDP